MSAVFCPARPAVALGARFSVRLLTARPISSKPLETQPFRPFVYAQHRDILHAVFTCQRSFRAALTRGWVAVRRGKDSDFENPVNALHRLTWKNPCGSTFLSSEPSSTDVMRQNGSTTRAF